MTNMEMLMRAFGPRPDVQKELRRINTDWHFAYAEWCEPVDPHDDTVAHILQHCFSWSCSPQGGEYWYDLFTSCVSDKTPLIPEGIWVDAVGVLHKEAA